MEFLKLEKRNKISYVSFTRTESLNALNGQTLTARKKDGKIYLKDSQGNMSEIIATDIAGSNGVIHVISSVVMPE